MLAAVLAHPDKREVFPLAAEPMTKQDGSGKNDCERTAAKRMLDWLIANLRSRTCFWLKMPYNRFVFSSVQSQDTSLCNLLHIHHYHNLATRENKNIPNFSLRQNSGCFMFPDLEVISTTKGLGVLPSGKYVHANAPECSG